MPAPRRTSDPYTHWTIFAGEALVACPRCGGCAYVHAAGAPPQAEVPSERFAPRVLTCGACGYARQTAPGQGYHGPGGGTPTDGWFDAPLWLVEPCSGEMLWAYNAAHLAALERYVRADLRERRPEGPADGEGWWSNSSMQSRLPRWMKAASNREAVLRAVARLWAKNPVLHA